MKPKLKVDLLLKDLNSEFHQQAGLLKMRSYHELQKNCKSFLFSQMMLKNKSI